MANGNPNYGQEAVGFFSLNNQSLTRSWPLDWRGYFEQRIKWTCSFEFGVWTWPLEASHYAQMKAPLTIIYWLSAHFFGLSTKFGHSIARPLDLDNHSVNRPLDAFKCCHWEIFVGRNLSSFSAQNLIIFSFLPKNIKRCHANFRIDSSKYWFPTTKYGTKI
jgi:hypothetical protein